jgi:hypothetical protein
MTYTHTPLCTSSGFGFLDHMFSQLAKHGRYYTTILLYYCTTVLLYYYTILIYYCTTVLLYYYTILIYYYTTIQLYYYTTILLYRFDISLNCVGDLYIDDHHTAEDCALALGRHIGVVSVVSQYNCVYSCDTLLRTVR